MSVILYKNDKLYSYVKRAYGALSDFFWKTSGIFSSQSRLDHCMMELVVMQNDVEASRRYRPLPLPVNGFQECLHTQ
jgi:hypothetical protein